MLRIDKQIIQMAMFSFTDWLFDTKNSRLIRYFKYSQENDLSWKIVGGLNKD